VCDVNEPAETAARTRDAELRGRVEAGDLRGAACRFLELHGGEILAFLVVRLRDPAAASEVFSQFTEDLWRGLPGFRWTTTLRSWAYSLARNAANRFQVSRRRRELVLAHPSDLPERAQERRSSTAPYLRTELKRRVRALRDRLPVDDQLLLVLRIDKRLSWHELAAVFSGEGEALEPAARTRWAARLRQRFATVKERLRALAEEEGLIDPR
jgi:RNA polymerase sigma-70 factor (ECF subfamily)